jgi:hypothetical protein
MKEKAEVPRDIPLVERNYIVRERSHAEPPVWSYDFMNFSHEMQGQERYFFGESGETNDRVAGCDLAKARARKEIAQELATYIKSDLAESAEGQAVINKMESSSNQIDRRFESILRQETLGLLSGVELVSTTWEERDYTQAGGSNSVFHCMALVKINKKTLEDIINKNIKKVIQQAPIEKRASLLNSTKDIAKEFTGSNATN